MRFLCLKIMDYLKCLMFLLISALYAAKVHGKTNCTDGSGVKNTSLCVIIDISKGADVNCGDNFKLSCTFNTSELSKVSCTWKRNGTVVKLDDSRYKSNVTKGNNATCIFEIADATAIDAGNWTCGLLASDENDGVNSANITVNIAQGNKCNNSKETDKGSDKGNLNSPTKSESSLGNFIYYILLGVSAALILLLSSAIVFLYCTRRKAKKELEDRQEKALATTQIQNSCLPSDIGPVYQNFANKINSAKTEKRFYVEMNDDESSQAEVIYSQVMLSRVDSTVRPSIIEKTEYATVTIKRNSVEFQNKRNPNSKDN